MNVDARDDFPRDIDVLYESARGLVKHIPHQPAGQGGFFYIDVHTFQPDISDHGILHFAEQAGFRYICFNGESEYNVSISVECSPKIFRLPSNRRPLAPVKIDIGRHLEKCVVISVARIHSTCQISKLRSWQSGTVCRKHRCRRRKRPPPSRPTYPYPPPRLLAVRVPASYPKPRITTKRKRLFSETLYANQAPPMTNLPTHLPFHPLRHSYIL